MTLIDKKQLLSDIVNLPSQLGISSKGVDATYMDGYLSGKAQRQLEIIDIINKQRVSELEKPKKKRKFKIMTEKEWCDKTNCKKCEYFKDSGFCEYLQFNEIIITEMSNTPYKTKAGKYILIEVKE